LLLALVRQHGPAHHVADGIEIGQAGGAMAVHFDEAAGIALEPHAFGAEAVGVRHPPDGDDEFVELQRFPATVVLAHDTHIVLAAPHLAQLHAQPDIQALLLGEDLPGFARDRLVGRGQELRQGFQHCHGGAEPAPHAAQFQADHPGADDAELLRHRLEIQRADVVAHELIVDLHARQGARLGAGSDHDVLRLYGLARHIQLPALLAVLYQPAVALQPADLVLPEQELDPAGHLADDRILARDHFRHVDACAAHLDAVQGEPLVDVVVLFRRLQQRFGGTAPDVEAGAAEHGLAGGIAPCLDTSGLEPQLRRADRADVAGGTGTDDDDIEGLITHFKTLKTLNHQGTKTPREPSSERLVPLVS